MTIGHPHRQLARALVKANKGGTPLRHARGVVVSSTIGQTQVTLDGGATQVPAFNYGHTQSLPAGTVVDTLVVGKKAYVLGAYGTVPYASRVWRTAAWTSSATATMFGFDTVTFDPYSSYSLATHFYTCPVPGNYRVSAQLAVQATAVGQQLTVGIYQNGTLTARDFPWSGAAGALSATVTDLLPCAAGDTISVEQMTSPSGLAGRPASDACFMVVELAT